MNTTIKCTRIEDILVEYGEGALSNEQKAMVEEHLKQCDRCSKELDHLGRMSVFIRKHAEALCPDPLNLYMCINKEKEPDEDEALHLKYCPHCKETVKSLARLPDHETMPPEILSRVRETLAAEHDTYGVSSLWGRIRPFFNVRTSLGLAAPAVAVLVLVMVYPRTDFRPQWRLSSISWQGFPSDVVPKVTPMPSGKEMVAVVLSLEGFRDAFPQEDIDSFYQALAPPGSVLDRYEFMSPGVLQRALASTKTDSLKKEELITELREKLNVPKLIVLTVRPQKDRGVVRSELIDTRGGNTIRKTTERTLAKEQLKSQIDTIAYDVLKK